MAISNAQLAELLAGIAKTNAALLNATLDQQTMMQRVVPTLQGQAQIANQQPTSLQNIYARILLQSLGSPQPGKPPLHQHFGQELDKLAP